jgi:hypothetical protein
MRKLWKYPESYPRERLLALDDFVTPDQLGRQGRQYPLDCR